MVLILLSDSLFSFSSLSFTVTISILNPLCCEQKKIAAMIDSIAKIDKIIHHY